MTHRRARMPAVDRPRYVPITEEQLEALRTVARTATDLIAADATFDDVDRALDVMPHVLDDLALADSHAERVADLANTRTVVDRRRQTLAPRRRVSLVDIPPTVSHLNVVDPTPASEDFDA